MVYMKKSELLTIVIFCAFLLSMVLCYLFLPKVDFSVTEKRYLAEFPELSWDEVASGDWGEDAETYMADHIPGRDFFVGLNAYFDLLTGRQVSKDIWLQDGRLLEAPAQNDDAAVKKNMAVINSFAQTIGQQVDLMLVPSSGWAAGLEAYTDATVIDTIYALAEDSVEAIPVSQVFEGKPELFFRTDHHWNSSGAYAAYQAYMEAIGRDFRPADSFEKDIYASFQGSTYSRSALWLTPAEDLELWLGSDSLTVTNEASEEPHQGVYYWERLEEADKYTVFLDGNHSIVRVQNPDAQGKLLVIRDSYSNSLGCFLAESYGEVVLIDLRYYRQAVSELIAQEAFDDILICYSFSNFLTDTNLVWLR